MAPATAFRWLAAGWQDFTIKLASSLSYGFLVFLVSIGTVASLIAFGWDYILFPAFAGFMVVGPVIAVGLTRRAAALLQESRSVWPA